jgi:phosphatidylglycerophosphate synthase
VATAACIQLRLLCNLLDCMVAIEGGKSAPTGALFNEMPDRFADPLFRCRSVMPEAIRGSAG